MSTEKDIQIFCCGVTQNAMASGKFDIEDIPRVADAAYDWFVGKFGVPVAQDPFPPKSSPSASQSVSGQGGSGGPQKPDWQVAAQAMAGGEIPAETKNFNAWAGDNAYIYGQDGMTWADLLGSAQEGSDVVRQALEKAAKAGLGKDPKWFKNNAKRIARAKRCLEMLRQTTPY